MKETRQRASEGVAQGFVHILIGDVDHALERVKYADTPTHRREAIRTVFAAVEGIVWVYREHVRETARDLGRITTLQDFAIQEKSYAIGERGDLVEQIRFVPITTMVRLVTKIAAEVSSGFAVDFSHVGWANLKTAITVRNRLTHPKSLADLSINQNELDTAKSGFFWLLALVIEGMAAMNDEVAAFTSDARAFVEQLIQGDQSALEEYRRASDEIDD